MKITRVTTIITVVTIAMATPALAATPSPMTHDQKPTASK
jgi:hypothetical protein